MGLIFLGFDEVIEIHRDQVDRYGGATGIRDIQLLESAIAMPAAGFGGQYAHGDIFEMAGAYLFHIIKNHPFVDGNKRTGAVAALVFLALNGVEIDAEPEAFERIVWAVAKGRADKAAVARFFRKCAQG